MTAPRVRADYEQLTTIAQTFGQQAEAAQKVLRALQDNVNALQGGDWVGKGAEAFYAEMNSAVLPAVQRVVNAMNVAASTTTKISQIVKQAEDDAAALFRLDGSSSLLTPTQRQSPPDGIAALMPDAGGAGASATGAGGTSGSPSPAPVGARERAGGAKDPRAEKIQPILDEANHLKEMYEDTVRERQERQRKYEEAVRLKKDEREILRLRAELRAMQHAEKYYEEDMTAKYNEAIDLTVKLYKIDLSAVKGKPEYFHGTKLSGYTDYDRTIVIGQDGVGRSPGWLASTIGHEAVHARQMKENRSYDEEDNPQGYYMTEIEGYHWELANAARNGLTPDEIEAIKRVCQSEYYDKLDPINKERVNQGIYKPA